MTVSLASIRDLALLTVRLGRPTIAATSLPVGGGRQPGLLLPRPGRAATQGGA